MKQCKTGLLVLIFCLVASQVFSQSKNPKSTRNLDEDEYIENRDSVYGLDFDFSELDPSQVKIRLLAAKLKRIRMYNDSMMAMVRAKNIKERSDSLEQLYDLMAGDSSSSYNAYSFFAGRVQSSVNGINAGIGALGFPKFNPVSYHITNFLNFTWKRNHFMNELYLSVGLAQTVSKGDISITYNYKSPVNYNVGYCIVDKKRFQLFPYAGLMYQVSSLDFVNGSEQLFDLKNHGYDTLLFATTNNKRGVEYNLKKREIVLNYGLEVDFHVAYSKRRTGFIVGLRGGGTLPLLSTGWTLDGGKYDQFNDLKLRNYYIDLVLRLYLRRQQARNSTTLQRNWWENSGR